MTDRLTPREAILEQIHHRETRPIPFTLPIEQNVCESLDEHYGGPSWRQKLKPYIVSVGGIPMMQRKAISDNQETDLFGSIWRIDRRPRRLEKPALLEPSFEGYTFPSPDAFVDPNLKENVQKALQNHPNSFTTLGMGWGLWEGSWGIRGFENALMDVVAEPDFFEELLDRLTEIFVTNLAKFEDLPADAVMFGDDWGDQRGVMIGPERWRKFMKPRFARIYEAVHAQGKRVISHCCGSIADIMPDIIEIGMDVLESVQPEARGMNPYELKKKWGDKITFWGGLGSQSVIPFGTPDEIRSEVRKLCREMGKGGGYILAPAKPLQPETPTENAVAVLEAFANQE
jgi:uroporphyrinogen decarboxylase